jgi:hypothetical protein
MIPRFLLRGSFGCEFFELVFDDAGGGPYMTEMSVETIQRHELRGGHTLNI